MLDQEPEPFTRRPLPREDHAAAMTERVVGADRLHVRRGLAQEKAIELAYRCEGLMLAHAARAKFRDRVSGNGLTRLPVGGRLQFMRVLRDPRTEPPRAIRRLPFEPRSQQP